jgi:hypothetical protein
VKYFVADQMESQWQISSGNGNAKHSVICDMWKSKQTTSCRKFLLVIKQDFSWLIYFPTPMEPEGPLYIFHKDPPLGLILIHRISVRFILMLSYYLLADIPQ